VLAFDQRFDEALSALDDILEEDPTNAEALGARAQIATWAGNYSESIVTYDRLLAENPEATETRRSRAGVLVLDQQYQRAAAEYEQLLASNPDDREALLGLGRVLAWTGQRDSANTVFNRVLADDPNELEARRFIAQLTTWDGDLQEGEALWRAVLETNPDDVPSLLGLTSNLRSQGRNRAARDVLARAEILEPGSPGAADEGTLIDRAIAPFISPSFSFVTDSDENEVQMFTLNASWRPADFLELRAGGSRRSFDQPTQQGLANDVMTGDFAVSVRTPTGWSISGGLGVWQPEDEAIDPVTTATAGLSSPSWGPARASLTFERTAYDVSALVIDENRIERNEVRFDGSVNLNSTTSLLGSFGRAGLAGIEDNSQILGLARLNVQFQPWLTAGPALRAFHFEKDLNEGYWDPDFYGLAELPVVVSPTVGSVTPRLEVAPGYQRIQDAATETWSVSIRLLGGLTYNLGPRRQIGAAGVWAKSGLQQLSSSDAGDYTFRGVFLTMAMAF
jgi:tetratricopeptide (TPR) repeat protein